MSLCFCVMGDYSLGRDSKSLQIHTFLVSAHNVSASLAKESAHLLIVCLLPRVLTFVFWEGDLLVKTPKSPHRWHCLIHLSVCLCTFYICAFSNFILSTLPPMCFHYLIFMCQSDWGRDQPPLPSIRHKTLNLTSVATKIIGSPETKWTDTTSGIYSTDKSSSLSVTTDFSESLQSPVSRTK